MFEILWAPARTRTSDAYLAALGALLQAESDDAEDPVLPFTVEEPDVDPEREERFLAALSDEQQTAYHEIKAVRDAPEPRLSLEVIQRYVLWRAFDLGWTIERFGDLDWRISDGDSNARSDTRKPERVRLSHRRSRRRRLHRLVRSCGFLGSLDARTATKP
ncbi:hypothetical protein [Candidatus Poriferisodalis sp.]|uniref:hypothetical protein n=1 Tax=Candidatus Poriferisodalis sp. TaxID=3101277 RepID=UPI003B015509